MNGYDITLTIVIIFVFILLFLAPIFSVGIQKIKNNWVEYRCNPIIMPFAGLFGEDPTQTFSFCIQSMLKDFMGFLLIPLQQSIKVIQGVGGGFETAINDVRKAISAIRSFVTQIIQAVFGVLLNILVEIQKLIINMKDLMGKLIGIMTTLLFMVYGSMEAMQSAWNGPPGQLMRALCFKSTTKLRLSTGGIKYICELDLGDTLKDGSVVTGVLKLKNTTNENFYKITRGESNDTIFVTGSHMIQDNNGEFIPVKNHSNAVITDEKCETLYCLMTSTNRIVIGERTFWDWNDDEVAKKPK